jgi:hypothetical protein
MTKAWPLEEPCAANVAYTVLQTSGGSDPFAEFNRTLRPVVLWRKSSFGTQSRAGSDFVERMLTVVATLRQQQRNVLEYVTTTCEAVLYNQSPPSLLPPARVTADISLRKVA